MLNKQEEIEHSLISTLLGVSLVGEDGVVERPATKQVFLSEYKDELLSRGKKIAFLFDDIENIVFYRLRVFFSAPDSKSRIKAFHFLIDSYNKFMSEGLATKKNEIVDKISTNTSIFPKYCALIIQCPELFEPASSNCECAITDLFEISIPNSFFYTLVQEMENNDSKSFSYIFTEYIEKQVNILNQRKFIDLKLQSSKNIIFLSQFKQTALILTQAPSFIKTTTTNHDIKISSGLVQQSSILGCIIGPNPIDKDFKTNENPVIAKYFSGLLSKSPAYVNQSKLLIKQELSLVYEQSVLFIKNLLKANTESRRRVIKWMSLICTSNEGKPKIFNSIPDLSMFGDNQNSRTIQNNLRSLIYRTSGLSTNGFLFNFLHIALKLLQPVKIEKVSELDCLFHIFGQFDKFSDISSEVSGILGDLIKDATLGEKDQFEVASKLAKEKLIVFNEMNLKYQECVKFPTQIFWISCKSIRCFMQPVLLEYEGVLNDISEYRNGFAPGHRFRNDNHLEQLTSEALLLECTIFHPNTVSIYWHFLSLFIHFVFRTIFSFDENGIESCDWNSLLVSKQGRISLLLKTAVPITKPSPQFSSIPSSLIEDVLAVTEHMLRIKGNDDIFIGFDLDSYISLVVFVISYGDYFRNPHTRCQRGVVGIHYLLQIHQFKNWIENNDFTAQYILPGLISLFNDVQKSPYYDRFALRLPVIMLFESMLKIDLHRKRLHVFVKQKDESFTKFIHLLVSDLNYLLEEGLSMLAEIKKRECTSNQQSTSTNNETGHNNSNPEAVNSNQDGNESTIEEMPIERLENACKGYMQLSHASASLLQKITEYYTIEILDSPLVLPQIVTCLNCTLDRLVGPKCLELKVSNFEAYNFNPRQLLANVCMAYVTLAFNSKNEGDGAKKEASKVFISEIINEQRYFKISTFIKAHKIVRREGLINTNKSEYFNQLIKHLQKELEENEIGCGMTNIDEADIPEEFLDPIMQDIMHDPVLLPTSSKIMDRMVIERILISDGVDPFNRLPLSRDELIPQKSLKDRIQSFLDNIKGS
ncbi:ubiquitin-fusion degadation-2 (UFD2) like protein [Cryptosporidium canis]|uniref:Ubiquitin-fusion degadation-2 (UFD2) like protein n=1 Tax=Cryptosporidium canis TaxID=195482 RepID=A0ABQ8P409_9CRYT|nr:ubiquitin-fusion degadation-2 (UFD2) like protein [Cryptosporidium canis]KAJ1609608.1 ubiquitin-fusion degadation-2 (UFD2) like protein [Cryptosporidium canis]